VKGTQGTNVCPRLFIMIIHLTPYHRRYIVHLWKKQRTINYQYIICTWGSWTKVTECQTPTAHVVGHVSGRKSCASIPWISLYSTPSCFTSFLFSCITQLSRLEAWNDGHWPVKRTKRSVICSQKKMRSTSSFFSQGCRTALCMFLCLRIITQK
jgi:hypothetical protein